MPVYPRALTIIVLAALLSACGGGSSSGGSTSLVGVYNGRIASIPTSFSGPLRLSIASDDGTNFSGTGSSPNSAPQCGRTFGFAGTRTGTNLTAGGTLNNQTVAQFSATRNGNTLSGTYRTVAGPCNGDYGTFSVTR